MGNTTKVIPEGMEECIVCEGKGEDYFTCCGDIASEDSQRCSCGEGVGLSPCEDCDGTGWVPKGSQEGVERPSIYDPIGKAEDLMDAAKEREWGL